LEGKGKGLTFAHAFRERGAVEGKKSLGFFFGKRKKAYICSPFFQEEERERRIAH